MRIRDDVTAHHKTGGASRVLHLAFTVAVAILVVSSSLAPVAEAGEVADTSRVFRTTNAREVADLACRMKAGGSSFRGTSQDGKVSGLWRPGVSAVDCGIPMENLRVTSELRRNGSRVASLRWFHCGDRYNADDAVDALRCDDAATKPGAANYRCADGSGKPCTGRWQVRHHYRVTFLPGVDTAFTHPSWCTKSGRTLSCTISTKVMRIP